MSKMVHARLDDETAQALDELVVRLSSNESSVIRRALLHLANTMIKPAKKRVIGLGKFATSDKDRGSNKRHLNGFGK